MHEKRDSERDEQKKKLSMKTACIITLTSRSIVIFRHIFQ